MSEKDLINSIIASGQALKAEDTALDQRANDTMNAQLARRQAAAETFPTFGVEFAEVVAGVNTAIAPSGFQFNIAQPSVQVRGSRGRTLGPKPLGELDVVLNQTGKGGSRVSVTMRFNDNGNVGLIAKGMSASYIPDMKLNIIDSSADDFRAFLLEFCKAALEK